MRNNNPVATSSGGDPHISPEQGNAPFKMGFKQNTDTSIDLYLYGPIESSYYDFWNGAVVEGNSTDFFKRVLLRKTLMPHRLISLSTPQVAKSLRGRPWPTC